MSKDDPIELGPAKEKPRSFGLDKHREETRGKIALRLIWLLIAVVTASFVTIWIDMSTNGSDGLTAGVKDLLQLVLGPIITLLGTVTGFYFGAHSRQSADDIGKDGG